MTRKITHQTGFAAVELTIAAPIMLLLILVAVDFGRVMSESITTTSAASSSTGYGFIHANDLEVAMDQVSMNSMAEKESTSLTVNQGEAKALNIVTERLCRCYDADVFNDGGTLAEPTAANCALTCPDEMEVYIQTSVTRDFNSLSNFLHIPSDVTINRVARYRAQ
ncbi:TadE family protein [Vibrio bathopelagicus]